MRHDKQKKKVLRVPRYQIFAKNKQGEVFRCFAWYGKAEDGIRRAKSDAKDFNNQDIASLWAEPC